MDFVVSVFRLNNRRGYSLPAFNFSYREKDTQADWIFTCGGTRAYMVRHATPLNHNMGEQAADSHFMVRRITAALFMSGFGLFHAEPSGRVLFKNVWGDKVEWTAQIDQPDPEVTKMATSDTEALYGWIGAICTSTHLRRAAEDAYNALQNPHEALIYVYRGFEWLIEGFGFTWDGIACELGGTREDIRNLKKAANFEHGVRHASKSGMKLRAEVNNYGSWVAGLFDMINVAREKLDPVYRRVDGETGGRIVARAILHNPFE